VENNPRLALHVLWVYGGREGTRKARSLLDSIETARGDFYPRFTKETMFEDVLGE